MNNNNKDYSMLWNVLYMITGMMVPFFFWYLYNRYPIKVTETKTEIIYDIADPFTEQKVRDYLKELHVRYPEVAIAQMKLESTSGTSNIFRQNNNLFGMKNPEKRPTTSLGIKNDHAYYSHWRLSVVDYALYQAFVSNAENISTEEEWINYVGHMYAEDSNYKKKLISIRNSLNGTRK